MAVNAWAGLDCPGSACPIAYGGCAVVSDCVLSECRVQNPSPQAVKSHQPYESSVATPYLPLDARVVCQL